MVDTCSYFLCFLYKDVQQASVQMFSEPVVHVIIRMHHTGIKFTRSTVYQLHQIPRVTELYNVLFIYRAILSVKQGQIPFVVKNQNH